MTEIAQRRLYFELRYAIDNAMRSGRAIDRERVIDLTTRNPKGAWGSHVQHNLGQRRRAWLANLVKEAK